MYRTSRGSRYGGKTDGAVESSVSTIKIVYRKAHVDFNEIKCCSDGSRIFQGWVLTEPKGRGRVPCAPLDPPLRCCPTRGIRAGRLEILDPPT